MKRLALAMFLPSLVSACFAEDRAISESRAGHSTKATRQEASTMKIRMKINGKSMTATLTDSPTTRDFIAMLPLTLKLDDYESTEKIAYLPKKLSTKSAPAGIDPDVGDITYYAPWGNLAIFYRDFGYSKGLIKLGQIDSGVEVLNVQGSLKVTIEAVAN
jgi:hypothetical protein